MRQHLIDELIEMAEQDERVWLIYADVGYSFVEQFEKRFPERCVNAGIREQLAIGMAAGLAIQSKRPFVYSMATFITRRCYEQIAIDVAHANRDVVILGVADYRNPKVHMGYSHWAEEDLSITGLLPNIKTHWPSAENLAEVLRCPGPAYIRITA